LKYFSSCIFESEQNFVFKKTNIFFFDLFSSACDKVQSLPSPFPPSALLIERFFTQDFFFFFVKNAVSLFIVFATFKLFNKLFYASKPKKEVWLLASTCIGESHPRLRIKDAVNLISGLHHPQTEKQENETLLF
jgi:hypothetical protein